MSHSLIIDRASYNILPISNFFYDIIRERAKIIRHKNFYSTHDNVRLISPPSPMIFIFEYPINTDADHCYQLPSITPIHLPPPPKGNGFLTAESAISKWSKEGRGADGSRLD